MIDSKTPHSALRSSAGQGLRRCVGVFALVLLLQAYTCEVFDEVYLELNDACGEFVSGTGGVTLDGSGERFYEGVCGAGLTCRGASDSNDDGVSDSDDCWDFRDRNPGETAWGCMCRPQEYICNDDAFGWSLLGLEAPGALFTCQEGYWVSGRCDSRGYVSECAPCTSDCGEGKYIHEESFDWRVDTQNRNNCFHLKYGDPESCDDSLPIGPDCIPSGADPNARHWKRVSPENDVECRTCKTTCPEGQNLVGRCEGTAFGDTTSCVGCPTSCLAGQYRAGSCEDAAGATCSECTNGPAYDCGQGNHRNGAACDGTGDTNTQMCDSCTGGASYDCGQGFFRTGSACDGLGNDNAQTCMECTGGAARQCPGGCSPFGTACDGTGTSDTQICSCG